MKVSAVADHLAVHLIILQNSAPDCREMLMQQLHGITSMSCSHRTVADSFHRSVIISSGVTDGYLDAKALDIRDHIRDAFDLW